MDRGAWRATVHGATESDTTERLTLFSLFTLASLLFPCTGGDLDQRSGRWQGKHAGGRTTLLLHWKHTTHLISGLFKPKAGAAPPRTSLADQGGGEQIFLLLRSLEGNVGSWGNNSSSHDLAPEGNHCLLLFFYLFYFFFNQPSFSFPLVITSYKLTAQNLTHPGLVRITKFKNNHIPLFVFFKMKKYPLSLLMAYLCFLAVSCV